MSTSAVSGDDTIVIIILWKYINSSWKSLLYVNFLMLILYPCNLINIQLTPELANFIITLKFVIHMIQNKTEICSIQDAQFNSINNSANLIIIKRNSNTWLKFKYIQYNIWQGSVRIISFTEFRDLGDRYSMSSCLFNY